MCYVQQWRSKLQHLPLHFHAGCDATQQGVHQEFLGDMARFIKAVDPNHLLTTSTEGFFMATDANQLHLYNPGELAGQHHAPAPISMRLS